MKLEISKKMLNERSETHESKMSLDLQVRKKKAPPFKHSDIDYNKIYVDEVIE